MFTLVIAYAVGMYIVHTMFMEWVFSWAIIRLAWIKPHPLLKKKGLKVTLGTILCLIGGIIYIFAMLFLPTLMTPFLIPLVLYIQCFALKSALK